MAVEEMDIEGTGHRPPQEVADLPAAADQVEVVQFELAEFRDRLAIIGHPIGRSDEADMWGLLTDSLEGLKASLNARLAIAVRDALR